ncbi:MAG: hypothetical protein Q9222_004629, partial [Ikaeria aurantiellina]
LGVHKPIFSVPQAFPAQDFWLTTPTADQVAAMVLLAINHGARGIVGWLFPTDPAIEDVTSRLSTLVLDPNEGMAKYLLGGGTEVSILGSFEGSTDAKAWRMEGKGGDVLVSVVFMQQQPFDAGLGLRLAFPADQGFVVKGIGKTLWGGEGWMVDGRDGVRRVGMRGEESWVFEVEVDDVIGGGEEGVATA